MSPVGHIVKKARERVVALPQQHPTGKPEALQKNLSGPWPRRIDQSNRLVYQVSDSAITLLSLCYYH